MADGSFKIPARAFGIAAARDKYRLSVVCACKHNGSEED